MHRDSLFARYVAPTERPPVFLHETPEFTTKPERLALFASLGFAAAFLIAFAAAAFILIL